MVNRVILAGVLVSDLKKADGERLSGYGKIRVTRFRDYYTTLSYRIWGKAVDFLLSKNEFKAGVVVQAIGSLSTKEGKLYLDIDTMSVLPTLSKVYKESPWDKDGTNQAS